MAAPRKASKTEEPLVRATVREEVRSGIGHNSAPAGRAVAIGRDGKPIWRHSAMHEGHDKFAIPPELIQPGWVMQWKAHTVLNQPDPAYEGKMRSAGWVPVMAEDFPGRYMPLGHTGPIIVDGLMLMETPEALWKEAVAEENRIAAEKVNRSKVQHGLAPATSGVATDTRGARQSTFVRTAMDTGIDIPRPDHSKYRQPID